MQKKAEPALYKLFKLDNPRHRARALWLLVNIKGRAENYVQLAIKDLNPDIRITGLRAARRMKLDVINYVRQLVRDRSPQVRRECAIALRHNKSSETAKLWTELAIQHDGQDRWYLEALGIGADQQWDKFLTTWLDRIGNKWDTPAGRDLIWRSRSSQTAELLEKVISTKSITVEQLPRYFRAFDFQPNSKSKSDILERLAFGQNTGGLDRQTYIASESMDRISGFDINSHPHRKAILEKVLEQTKGTLQFVKLTRKFQDSRQFPELLAMAQNHATDELGIASIRTLLDLKQRKLIQNSFSAKANNEKDESPAIKTARVLGTSGDGRAVALLTPVMNDEDRPLELRRAAARAIGKNRKGALDLVKLVQQKKLDENLSQAVAAALHSAQWRDVK